MLENDIPKYKKKKESSTSKSAEKSDHKHEYTECLFIVQDEPHRGKYCKTCGKIGDIQLFDLIHLEGGMYKTLTRGEVYAKYEDLERVPINNIFQKYV